jgi:hypothetical protein
VFNFAQPDGRGGEGNREAYPCRMFVAGERPSLDEQRAAQLALRRREDRGREREQISRGREGVTTLD